MTSELGTNSRGPRTDEISRVAKLLMETWYRVDPSSTVTKEPASYVANFADMAKTMIADWNTRAVPDVPELERYRLTHDKFHCDDIMVHNENGEYVRYDQAAELIAAKDKEVQELKEKLGVVSTERHADAEYIGLLQAELAQIKAQKPVAYFSKINGVIWFHVNYTEGCTPVYAAPVDQTAEIERLREALNYYANVSPISYDMGHAARAALSGKDPQS